MQKEQKEAVNRSEKKRILYLSNSANLNTGFSQCVRNICSRLTDDYEVITIGDSFCGEAIKPEGTDYFIFPMKDGNQLLLPYQLQLLEPDVIIMQEDLFTLINQGLHKVNYGKTKVILYAATDGETLSWNSPQILEKADRIVAMTNHGASVIERHGFEDSDVIYHGVDLELFKPLTKEQKIKAREKESELLKKTMNYTVDLKDKCLFLSIGRNSLRKDMQNLTRAYAKFAKGKKDVALLINSINFADAHLDIRNTVNITLPLLDDVEENLIGKKVFIHPAQSFFRGEPETKVAELTGMADAHVTAARGEGFGLCMLESMACGVPVISSEATTAKELVGETRGLLAKTIKQEEVLSLGIAHFIVDVDSLVEKFEEFYTLWKANKVDKLFKDNCIKFASEHTWDKKVEEWKTVIEKTLSQ